MKLIICTLMAASALGLAACASTSRTGSPKLYGTVGPGYTITLKQNGKLIRTLRHGTYTFVISDRSHEHDFALERAGSLPSFITGDGFVGRKRVTIVLKPGTYKYVCVQHEPSMFRTFKVI